MLCGGGAIVKAVGKIIDKGRKIAGYLLEASEQDIEFTAGKFTGFVSTRGVWQKPK